MWPTKRRHAHGESRSLLDRLHARGWKGEAERDEMLRRLAALPGLAPEDVAWMAADSDRGLRQSGLALLARFPYETAAPPLQSLLASRSEGVRRAAMAALQSLAGDTFLDRVRTFLSHSDPAVVHAALDWLRKNPSERALPWIGDALGSPSPAVRRKAFAIAEATASPSAAAIALKALDDDDENIRFRAVQLLAKYPDEAHVGPLLLRSRNDSTRVQDAAVQALTPLLARASTRWNEDILPLLCDGNPRVRQLASRILSTQEPARVAEAFLASFRNTFGPARERAIDALRELGPQYLRAFLEHDGDTDPAAAALSSSIAVTLRSAEVVSHCLRFLDGSDWWLRDRAAMALGEIKDERAFGRLVELLTDPDSNLSAAAALGVWGSPKALSPLLEAYKQAKTLKDLRLEILDAFARISDPRVGSLLESIVKADPDPLVKEKAARLSAALKGNGEESAAATGPHLFDSLDFDAVPRPTLPDLLRHARANSASDLHLGAGTVPHTRVNGRLVSLPLCESTPEQMQAWIAPILSEERALHLEEHRQIDFCHKDAQLGRFRTNVFFQRKGMNAVFRLVPYEVPNLTDIALPESLWELTTYSQGLVLVTGPAGCGKTTTLAALVDRINETQRCHIITIEDPIEFLHQNRESLVNQREVPSHSRSFARALRQTLREDPDVILVGEMRDLETIALAMTASETGHLVLATLHTSTAASTMDRIINAFSSDQQGQIRMMIADSLRAVISQTLLPRRDGAGRVAAYEILRNTPAVAGLIRDAKTFQLPTVMQTSAAAGMILMDGALLQLVEAGTIEPRVAYARALRKEAFEPYLAAEEGSGV